MNFSSLVLRHPKVPVLCKYYILEVSYDRFTCIHV